MKPLKKSCKFKVFGMRKYQKKFKHDIVRGYQTL